MAIYGERVALLPQLLQTLWYHPQGMRFSDLAREVGRSEAEVRETLRVYHLTDMAHYLPSLVARPDVLEFLAEDPEDDGDASTATMVRLGVSDPGAELGVSRIRLADLARLYELATDAVALHPDDEVLASAVRKLHDGVLPGFRLIEAEPWSELAELRAAIKDRCLIKITYARAWEPAIGEEVIAPYGVLRTHRGWELDAAPGDERSALRTYLLSNVRALEVLSETFEMPADLTELIRKHRREQIVIMEMPPAARWAVDKYSERVELVQDGPEVARLRVVLLQPYRLRAGLMLVAGGAAARVVEPVELRGAGAEVARAMLQRYEPEADS
ncbi:MAG TPA: WYL domain-containing protein [Microlunatus sp.]|nr:WYL domain-containing protein [Microlunatus sp.]